MPSATCPPHTGQRAAGLRQVRAGLIMDSAWGEGRANQCQPQLALVGPPPGPPLGASDVEMGSGWGDTL